VQKFSTDASMHRRMVSAMKIDRITAPLLMSTGLRPIFQGVLKRLVSSDVFAFASKRCALHTPRARCSRLHRARMLFMCVSPRGQRVAYTLP
jgi:hypothetical protein